MRSTFHGLETAKRGLFAQQTAMNTAGHNIANANTKGYSRQVVNFTASNAIEVPGVNHSKAPGQLGTGVDFSDINRAREPFLDGQFRDQNQSLGDWQVQEDTLVRIEQIINEPSDTGMRSVLDDFWNSWHDLANQPDNLTARSVVMENSVTLTNMFGDAATKLDNLESDIKDSINIKTYDLNTKLNQVAELNGEIFRIEQLGDNANDLRDQRDLITDEISKITNINVVETNRGYTISTGGTQLVSGNTAIQLDPNALPTDIKGGELHGYLASLGHVDTYRAQIDQMAKGLAEGEFTLTIPAGSVIPEGTTLTNLDGTTVTYSGANRTLTSDVTVKVKGVNGLHQLGYTLQEPAKAGEQFFTTKDGSSNFTADNIQVNPNIVKDVRNIAASNSTYIASTASGDVEKVLKGNNQVAVWIGQMRNTTLTFDNSTSASAVNGEGSIDDMYRSMVGRLGVQTNEATRQAENQKVLVDQVEMNRQSVSGVSLDEEMANLIKYQHAYNASARMLTTIDEMLDKVINGMGVVGR